MMRTRQAFVSAVLHSRLVEAQNLGEDLVRECSNDKVLWSQMGKIYLALGKEQESLAAFQRYLALPSHPLPSPAMQKSASTTWYSIGILHLRQRALVQARHAFQHVLHIDETFEMVDDVHFRLGLVCLAMHDLEPALKHFYRVLQHPPVGITSFDVLFHMSRVYEIQRNYDRALSVTQQLLDGFEHHRSVVHHLAHICLATPVVDEQEMLSLTDRIRQLSCHDVGPSSVSDLKHRHRICAAGALDLYLTGRCYLRLNWLREAITFFRKALELNSQNPTYWYYLGVASHKSTNILQSLECFLMALRLNPRLAQVWNVLGALYSEFGQDEDAVECFQRALSIDPNDAHARSRLEMLTNRKEEADDQESEASMIKRQKVYSMAPSEEVPLILPEMENLPHLPSSETS